MNTIHWLGAGLSSRPGFERLKKRAGSKLVLWSRNRAKAANWLDGSTEFHEYSLEKLEASLNKGDCVVSMLPAVMHPEVARACLRRGAHLVTSSYVSPEMRSFEKEATQKGLVFLNEVGLDPGIDHLFAHELVADLQAKKPAGADLSLTFFSVCGGFPANVEHDEFKYRFSWSPLGVLRALRNPCCWIEGGSERNAAAPATAIRPFAFRGETIEMYPNRDSRPYVADYEFDKVGKTDTFIRGTLRPKGWASAWDSILSRLDRFSEAELAALAEELGARYSYKSGERDRVCLEVRLSAVDKRSGWKYDRALTLDEVGSPETGTAMARTVSITTAIGVEAVLDGVLKPGVWGCPREPEQVRHFLRSLADAGIKTG